MKSNLTKFAESLELASKSVQTTAMSAVVAEEALKQAIINAQILIDEVTLAKHTIEKKDAEISKLNSELAIVREENQKLWDENQSIRANLDDANKKYIDQHARKEYREPTPAVPVMNKEEAIQHLAHTSYEESADV